MDDQKFSTASISIEPIAAFSSDNTPGPSNRDRVAESMVKCDFSGNGSTVAEIVELPEELISNPNVFYEILSKKTWDERLNDAQRNRLLKLLPENVSKSKVATDDFLTKFFDPTTSTSYFSHPLVDFQQKLAGGYYDAACANEIRHLKACSRLHYEHRLREYYGRVLKKMLVYRRKLLEAAASVPEGEPFSYDWKTEFLDSLHRQRNHAYNGDDGSPSPAWRRSLKRSRMMIMDCKARAGEPQTLSSDDEDYVPPISTGSAKGVNGHAGTSWHGHGRHLVFDTGHSSNSAVRSTLAKPNRVDLDLHEPFGNAEIKDMLKEYRRLRRSHPEHPSLEFDDTETDDVVDRCGTEIRLLAQKSGVYTKQPSALIPDPPPNTTLAAPTPANRKIPAAKSQPKISMTTSVKEK